ncbi:hypothetical protein SEA_PAELLA_233 [Arthrobacter phage Paella]|nr:hypothetical protein SEA_PAELLA_233 [Arthrobacter phage Paella]
MMGNNMREGIYSDGSSIDPNDISLFGVKGMKYGALPPMNKDVAPHPFEETQTEPGISKDDALRILEAHIQSDRDECKCGWTPTYFPSNPYNDAWTQHRDHLAEMLSEGVD